MEWLFKYYEQNLDDDELKPFELDKYYSFYEGQVSQILYNHKMTEIILSTDKSDNSIGCNLFKLPIIAETTIEEEDEDN